MRLGATELTYCLNVHPGESLSEVLGAVEGPALQIKQRLCPGAPFGLGLRLSARAVTELGKPGAAASFRRRLDELGMYTFTVNGFPYGTFHGEPVKDEVYLPDWSTNERREYTRALAAVMTELVPPGTTATISTLPLGYRLHGDSPARRAECARGLMDVVAALWRLKSNTGVLVRLALEPEPYCLLETTDEVVTFFDSYLRTDATLTALAQLCGVGRGAALDVLKAHLGVCLDTCHAAVEFEEPGALLTTLAAANIDVVKVQVSSGLRIACATDEARARLRAFDEPIYLHQVVARTDDTLKRYPDIRDALADSSAHGHEWRVHFHVPVHEARLAVFESTQAFTANVLREQGRAPFCEHWEVETYTWHVLPVKPTSLVDSICAELAWVQGQW